MADKKLVSLPGTERHAVHGARVTGPVPANQMIEVRVSLKPRADLQKKFDELAAQPLGERQYLTREEFTRTFSASDETFNKIEQFAHEYHLTVSRIDRQQNAIYLRGTTAQMNAAFGTSLELYQLSQGTPFRSRTGTLHVPEDVAGLIESVNGLDERPLATPKFRVRPPLDPHAGPSVTYEPQDLAKLYSFPTPANPGQGQTIAIVELGGGYETADLNTYFGSNRPTVTAVSVDNGHNTPEGTPDGADGEVLLDIEVAGGIAPKSKIAVYFAPNTNKGFLDAISAAVHDTTRKPSVVSISWGSPEDGGGFSAATIKAFEQVFQAAGVLGVTVLAAAGDGGSSDGVATGDHVDYPAASPSVTGCGGTKLLAPDKKTIQSETVWNEGAQGGATGGGVSRQFPVPTYQKGLKAARTSGGAAVALTGRGVPDIGGNADPVTGYDVLVDGQRLAFGGTSAVAPLLAGLVALLNQQLPKPVGFWNPALYKLIGTGALRDVTSGNNGTFAAASGWDACTGVGVPVGTALLKALSGA